MLNQENTAVITAMKNPVHISETLAALEIKLTSGEMEILSGYPVRVPCTVPLR